MSRLSCSGRSLILALLISLTAGVEILHLSRGITLLTRYTRTSVVCRENTTALHDSQEGAHFFTAGMYGLCSILRMFEYIPLFLELFRWYGRRDPSPNELNTQDFKKPLRILIITLLVLTMCLGLSIPVVGIAVEFVDEKRDGCGFSTAFAFYVYCFLNIFRYAWACNVRVAMVMATLMIKKIWQEVPNVQVNDSITAVRLHATLTDRYREAGERVRKINELFQTWFLFPWVAFFIASSVDAKNTLAIWDQEKNKVEHLPMIYLLLYNICQILLLLIPYMCGRKIDHYNQLSIIEIQSIQLMSSWSDEFRAQQRQMLIQKEDIYDFVPRVWGLGFQVKMNSLIYIIFLLLGLFFTICHAMLL